MAKYWVSLVQRAGVEVDAKSRLHAMRLAEEMDEAEYEIDQFSDGEWLADNAELLEEEE